MDIIVDAIGKIRVTAIACPLLMFWISKKYCSEYSSISDQFPELWRSYKNEVSREHGLQIVYVVLAAS